MSAINPIQYLVLRITEASNNPIPPATYTQLVDALQAVTVSSLEFDHSTKLLIYLTQYCSKIRSPPAILEAILRRWCADDNDVDGVIGDLASMISVPNEVLTYVCQTLGETSTLYGILERVIVNRKGSNIGFAITADRLITAFHTTRIDEQSDISLHGSWESLLQVAIRTEKPKNGDAYQYITEKLGLASQPVPRPKWVNVLEGETLQLLQKTASGQRPSSDIVDRVVQKIQSQIAVSQKLSAVSEGEVLTSEESSDLSHMIEMYVSTSIPEELELLDEYSKAPDDLEQKHPEDSPCDLTGRPERLWGPVNAMLDRDCSVNDGPCRMLSCLCRDSDQDCDEESHPQHGKSGFIGDPDAWFTGSCDSCRRRIINISYVLRFPVTNGGWVGCFCSWSCLGKNPPRPLFTEEVTAINRVKAVIDQFGILDRDSAPQ